MKPFQTEAIVLRRTNYGEADRILQLLTPEHGKVSAIAKGVRKEKSKLAGGIELLAVSEVVLHRGKGDMSILTGARLHTFFAQILKDYDKMQLAYEILKKISVATEMVPEPEWYYLAKQALTSLNQPAVTIELIEVWYRLQHSLLLGHELNLKADTEGNKLLENNRYTYDAQEMGLKVGDGEITAEHIKLLRLLTYNSPELVSQVGHVDALVTVCLWVVRQHDQG